MTIAATLARTQPITPAARPIAPAATPFDEVRAQLAQLAPGDPAFASAAQFDQWRRATDAAIRARLERGELDSMVHLLLFGTSFTQQPRMSVENLAAEARSGLLRARVDDLLKALRAPKDNARLQVLARLLTKLGHPPREASTGVFILNEVQRVLNERIRYAKQTDTQAAVTKGSVREGFVEDRNLFADRGVSLDTTILPNYGVDRALQQAKSLGLLRGTGVARTAILGPGLDFVDKDSGFDYYPLQTLQPFAVLDSLARLGLSSRDVRLTVLDVSSQVLDHISSARPGRDYVIQLPRKDGAPWTEGALRYWESFGASTGQSATPLALPANVAGVHSRAVGFRTPQWQAVDLDIITQRLSPNPGFDVLIATNILVYYDRVQQSLATANIAAMLAPGGLLITNDRLPELPLLRLAGQVSVEYSTDPRTGDTLFLYQRP